MVLTELQFKTLKLFAGLRPPSDYPNEQWFITEREWQKRHKASAGAIGRLRKKGLLERGQKNAYRITPKGIDVYRENNNGSDSTL